MRLSLRRSLCTALLVVATASPSRADWTQQEKQNIYNLLDWLGDLLTGINDTQSLNGHSTAWFLSYMRDILANNLGDIKTSVSSQSSSLDSLSTSLSGISDLVQNISDSIGSESDIDFSEITTKLDALQSAISSYSSSVSAIQSLLSSLSSNQVDPDELLESISAVSASLSSITTYSQFSSVIDGLKGEIADISARLDSTLDVSGSVEINSHSLYPLQNAIGQLGQKVFDFQTYFLSWYVGRTDGYYNEHTWLDFANKFDAFLLSFDSALTATQGIYSYLTGEFKEEFHDVWTNTVSYLPYLTNQTDGLLYTWLTNQIQRTPVYPGDPAWSGLSISDYPLAAILSRIIAGIGGGPLRSGYGSLFAVPLANDTSATVTRFFQRGFVSATPEESRVSFLLPENQEQRRWIYTISNTVPYIEGLPRHRQAVGESGSDWLSAWGDLQWEVSDPSAGIILSHDGRTPNRTPWNNQYLATDYFADLLKYLAASNLMQNAYYDQAILQALSATNNVDDIPEEPGDDGYQEPTDLDGQLDELNPEDFFPSEIPSVSISEYDRFSDESVDKIASALGDPVRSSDDSIVVFPTAPIFGMSSNDLRVLHFSEYMTAQDRAVIHEIFRAIWVLVYSVFVVYKVSSLIKDFVSAS